MTGRVAVGAGAAVTLGAAVVEYVQTDAVLQAGGAFLAGALAAAVAWLVATLPGLTLRGLATGGFFVVAGMVSWTHIERGWLVWAILTVEGVVFAVWSWPWLRHLRVSPRLGTAWLGVSYWLLGVAGALLVVHLKVGAQRVAYAGVFGLAVLAVIASVRRNRGRDLSVGVAGAFLLAIAALLLSGSGNLFDAVHAVPDSLWGKGQERRFWGGPWLLYHPNSLACLAVLVAIRIGPDRAFAAWQRLAVTSVGGLVLYWTNSRTGFFLFAVPAAAVHAFLLWRRRGVDLPSYRRPWLAAAAPFVVLALVLVLSGGKGFLFKERYGQGDITSGRTDTWKKVGADWLDAGWAEKAFGDARTARAVVHRDDDGTAPGEERLNLTVDNAAVGALRHGGVLGVLAFLVGLGLLLWHAVVGPRDRRAVVGPRDTRAGRRRAPPAWFMIGALASVPTIATSEWLLGGTGGTLWILLVAGEAWLLFGPAPDDDSPEAPAAAAEQVAAA